jgi:ribose-phosphate pyrophosphokinase
MLYDEQRLSDEDIFIFGGSANNFLTRKICEYLKVIPGKNETVKFSEGSIFVRILENVRGKHVYLIQSTIFPANEALVELLFWIDAFKRASVESVTAIIPFFSYGKGDKKDEPRVSIRAKVCADAIEAAGADRVVTMDLHAPQIQGFFRIPVDNLYAMPALCQRIDTERFDNLVVVAPDTGFSAAARRYASRLKASVAIADKRRMCHDEHAEVSQIMGDVKGKTAIIVDDFIISAGTLVAVSEKLIELGAKNVYAMVTHAAMTEGSVQRIDRSPLKKVFVTDTVENQPVRFSEKFEVVSVAWLFGEAIRCIHDRESISAMFI